MTVLAIDVETRLLASEVEAEHAADLAGASPWARADLFGLACGVAVDADTGMALRFGPGQAAAMLEVLASADATCGYNSASFDLTVLSAYGDVTGIRCHHLDINVLVQERLNVLAEERKTEHRLRQGGLDGLARSNGLAPKSGDGLRAVELFREGRVQEVLDYCEGDARLVADLYRIAQEHGGLRVDPYHRDADRNRIYLPRTTLPISL